MGEDSEEECGGKQRVHYEHMANTGPGLVISSTQNERQSRTRAAVVIFPAGYVCIRVSIVSFQPEPALQRCCTKINKD